MDQSKTVEDRITEFSPYPNPIALNLRGTFHSKILRGSPTGASNYEGVRKTNHFLDLNVNISKTVEDTSKLLLMNRKSHIRFPLTQRSMTFDVHDRLYVRIISEYPEISQIWEPITATRNGSVLSASVLYPTEYTFQHHVPCVDWP